jgi:crossover junction endodeoxyribonuclease RusA
VTPPLQFFVAGTPAPKGSMRAIPFRAGKNLRVSVKNDNPATKAWMGMVALQARQAMKGGEPLDRAVEVTLRFLLPRPLKHHGTRGLLASAPQHAATKPDIDKLVRAVLDALTGVVWVEDSRVIDVHARKDYGDKIHGVMVAVRAVAA